MRRFLTDDQGATAIEYGLIVAGVCLTIAGVIYGFSDEVIEMFDGLSGQLAE